MLRRLLIIALLLVFAGQLAGPVAFAAVCADETCPDDIAESSCPPVCSVCTGCAHSQRAVLAPTTIALNVEPLGDVAMASSPMTAVQLAADIFHVPLLG